MPLRHYNDWTTGRDMAGWSAVGFAKAMWARLLVGIFLCAAVSSPAPPRAVPTWQANPGVKRVLIISIDGLRPDVLLLADAPNIRALMKRGSYSLWARTIQDAYTLPAHATLFARLRPVSTP